MNSNNVLLQKYLKYKSKYLQAGGDDWFCNCINGQNVVKDNAFYKLIFEDSNADDDTQKNSLIEKLRMNIDKAKEEIAELILKTDTLRDELVFDAHPNLKILTKAYHNFENLLNVKLNFPVDTVIKMDATLSFPLFGFSVELTNIAGDPNAYPSTNEISINGAGRVVPSGSTTPNPGDNEIFPLYIVTGQGVNANDSGVVQELGDGTKTEYLVHFKKLAASINADNEGDYKLRLDRIIVNMMWWHFLKNFKLINDPAVLSADVTVNKFFILFINCIQPYLQTPFTQHLNGYINDNNRNGFGGQVDINGINDGLRGMLNQFMLVNAHGNVVYGFDSDAITNTAAVTGMVITAEFLTNTLKNLFSKAFLTDDGGERGTMIDNYPPLYNFPSQCLGRMDDFVNFIESKLKQ